MSSITQQVYMAVPDEEQTKEALRRVEELGREPGLGEVIWHELDLKDPRTAKASAERFMKREERLDILGLSPYQQLLSTALNIIPQSIMQRSEFPSRLTRVKNLPNPQLAKE